MLRLPYAQNAAGYYLLPPSKFALPAAIFGRALECVWDYLRDLPAAGKRGEQAAQRGRVLGGRKCGHERAAHQLMVVAGHAQLAQAPRRLCHIPACLVLLQQRLTKGTQRVTVPDALLLLHVFNMLFVLVKVRTDKVQEIKATAMPDSLSDTQRDLSCKFGNSLSLLTCTVESKPYHQDWYSKLSFRQWPVSSCT